MRIKRLFTRFAAVYGHIWQSQYKHEKAISLADFEWSETLENISDDNMELAFTECKKRYSMPPTLPAFYQLCRQFQPIRPSNYFIFEEIKIADPVVIEANLNEMRMIVKSKNAAL